MNRIGKSCCSAGIPLAGSGPEHAGVNAVHILASLVVRQMGKALITTKRPTHLLIRLMISKNRVYVMERCTEGK